MTLHEISREIKILIGLQSGVFSEQFGAFYYDAPTIPGPNDLTPENKRKYDRYNMAMDNLYEMKTKIIDGYAQLDM